MSEDKLLEPYKWRSLLTPSIAWLYLPFIAIWRSVHIFLSSGMLWGPISHTPSISLSCSLPIFKNRLCFREVSGSQKNGATSTRVPIYPLPPLTHSPPPRCWCPAPEWCAHYNQWSYMTIIITQSPQVTGGCTGAVRYLGLKKWIMTYINHYSIIEREQPHCPPKSPVLCLFIPAPLEAFGNH